MRSRLEQTEVRCSHEGQRLVVLCLRVNSGVSEIAERVGVAAEVLRQVVQGEAVLTQGQQTRVGAWLGVAWLRHAERSGVPVDEQEWADALQVAGRLGAEVREGCTVRQGPP